MRRGRERERERERERVSEKRERERESRFNIGGFLISHVFILTDFSFFIN